MSTDNFPVSIKAPTPPATIPAPTATIAGGPQVTGYHVDHDEGKQYRDGRLDCTQHTEEGILFLPVAKAGAGPVAIQVHSPYTIKRVEWTAERVGVPPKIPLPDTGNSQDVLLTKSINPLSPTLIPPGIPVFRIEGSYVFGMGITPGPNDPIACPVSPFDAASASSYSLTLANFDSRLIDASSVQASGGGTGIDKSKLLIL